MSRNRKVALGVLGGLGIVLLALLVLPLLFVEKVEERVRAEVERSTRVRVSWSDVGLDVLGDFPNPRLTLSGLSVVGTGSFEGDTLASVGDFRVSLGAASVLRSLRGQGALEVRSIEIAEPTVRLRVGEDGVASWDVLPEREEAGAEEEAGTGRAAGLDEEGGGRGTAVLLRSFELTDGSILFENQASGLFASVDGLDHSLRGDFSRDALVASTRAHADAVTVHFAGAPYLSDVSLDFEGDFDVDMSRGEARLVGNQLRLNDLLVLFEGTVTRETDRVATDLTFEAPGTDFGEVLSLVPVIYARDFASLETSGTFSLDGSVRGAMGEEAFPSFALNLDVADGRFRYPDLAMPAEAISAELAITNPGGHVDSTVVDLSRFHVEIGGQPMDASVTLRTPISDPAVDARAEGTLDLGDVAQTVKLENAEELGGVVVVDASVRARRSDVESQRYGLVAAEGALSARDVTLRGDELPQPVDIREAALRLSPSTAELSTFDARLGSSDLQASGQLYNLLGFVMGDQPLAGAASFTSGRFVVDEWRSEEEAGGVVPVPPRLDLTLDGSIDELVVNGIETRNARGRAIVRDQRVTFEGFGLETLGGRIALDGYYETIDPERPAFAVDIDLDSLDVAEASETLLTVRALAPVARYAQGTFSSSLALSGVLGQDLSPVIDVLDGDGSLSTSRVVIEGFPLLERLGERLGVQRLSNPAVQAVRSSIRIEDGRLTVNPFDVTVGGLAMTVSGSNGFDQSLDYSLSLQVPRSGMAEDALSSLVSNLGPAGSALASVDPVPVSVRVTGTPTQPSLDISLSEARRSVRDAATEAATAPVEERVEEAREQADSAQAEARRRAQARADSIVADARRRADAIRAEAAQAAARIREEGDRAAEEVLARATNPLTRAAAEATAERLRREADERASAIEREADERATAIVEEAEARAAEIIGAGSGGRGLL